MSAIKPGELARLKAAGRRMYEAGLTTGTLGSIGVRLPGGEVAVTCAGTRIGFLDIHDFLILDGNRLPINQNGRAPVMDARMLAAVLEAQPAAGTVIRVQSPHATTLAQTGRSLLELYDWLLEPVGGAEFVPYYRPGTFGLANVVAEALRDHRFAIIEEQGCVVWGEDIDDAVDHAEALEALARIIFILYYRDSEG